jgi:hypothetical protein
LKSKDVDVLRQTGWNVFSSRFVSAPTWTWDPMKGAAGLPRSAWSCCEDNITGQRRFLMYPALHYPSFIFAYLTYAQQFPDRKLTPIAITQAQQYADWQLTNRLPAD